MKRYGLPSLMMKISQRIFQPLEKDMNPDEVMAYGAAVKGGLLSSQDENSPKDEL